MMGFLETKGVQEAVFRRKAAKSAPKGGRVHGPFSLKSGVMRRPRADANCLHFHAPLQVAIQ
jgi:hypothetical protein